MAESSSDLVFKIASLLSTDIVLAKQQVWELLAVLCVFSSRGRERVIEAMELLKSTGGFRFRFSPIIVDLRTKDSLPSFYRAILSFVNAFLATEKLPAVRLGLDRELTSIGLLERVNELRVDVKDEQFQVQVDSYLSRRSLDRQTLITEDIDLNSIPSVFQALKSRVAGTNAEANLLSMLQYLLAIDGSDHRRETLWSCISGYVGKAVFLDADPSEESSESRFEQQNSGMLEILKQNLMIASGQEPDSVSSVKGKLGRRGTLRGRSVRAKSLRRARKATTKASTCSSAFIAKVCDPCCGHTLHAKRCRKCSKTAQR